MIPTTKRELLHFTPDDQKDKKRPISYLIGIPTIAGRGLFRRAIVSEGARYWGQKEMSAAAREVLEDVQPDNLDELLALLDRVDAGEFEPTADDAETAGAPDAAADPNKTDYQVEQAEELAAGEQKLAREAGAQKWAELLEMLSRSAPRIAGMAGDNQHYLSLSPIIAGSLFLRGWENAPQKFVRAKDGLVSVELLDTLPAGHLDLIWLEIAKRMQPSRGEEKNS